jgi:hypothetical protein
MLLPSGTDAFVGHFLYSLAVLAIDGDYEFHNADFESVRHYLAGRVPSFFFSAVALNGASRKRLEAKSLSSLFLA